MASRHFSPTPLFSNFTADSDRHILYVMADYPSILGNYAPVISLFFGAGAAPIGHEIAAGTILDFLV
jgi:hypothetical protein